MERGLGGFARFRSRNDRLPPKTNRSLFMGRLRNRLQKRMKYSR